MHLNSTKIIILLALFSTAVSGLPILYVKNKNPSTIGPPATTYPKKFFPIKLVDPTLPIPLALRQKNKKTKGCERIPYFSSIVKHGQNGWGIHTPPVFLPPFDSRRLTQRRINRNVVSMNEHLYPTGTIFHKDGPRHQWNFYPPGTIPPGMTQADVDLIKTNAPPADRSRLPPHGP